MEVSDGVEPQLPEVPSVTEGEKYCPTPVYWALGCAQGLRLAGHWPNARADQKELLQGLPMDNSWDSVNLLSRSLMNNCREVNAGGFWAMRPWPVVSDQPESTPMITWLAVFPQILVTTVLHTLVTEAAPSWSSSPSEL